MVLSNSLWHIQHADAYSVVVYDIKIILQICSSTGAKHIMTSVTSSFSLKLLFSSINLSALNIWKLFLRFSLSMSPNARALCTKPCVFHKQPYFCHVFSLYLYIFFHLCELCDGTRRCPAGCLYPSHNKLDDLFCNVFSYLCEFV